MMAGAMMGYGGDGWGQHTGQSHGGWSWSNSGWSDGWSNDDAKGDDQRNEPGKTWASYSYLGGTRRGSLPLQQQGMLLQGVLAGSVGQVRLSQWRGATMQATWWILARIDAAATSLASLGESEPWLLLVGLFADEWSKLLSQRIKQFFVKRANPQLSEIRN